jgi:hypothetical protein
MTAAGTANFLNAMLPFWLAATIYLQVSLLFEVGCSAQLERRRGEDIRRRRDCCATLCVNIVGGVEGVVLLSDAVEVDRRGTDVVVVNMRELPASIRSSAMLSRRPMSAANFQSNV